MPAVKRASVLMGLQKFAEAAADLVYPPTCPACRAATLSQHALCSSCWSQIQLIEAPFCPVYGTPFAASHGDGVLSAEAIADPPPFRRARFAAAYGEVARRLVHQVKYQDRPDLARLMALAMHRAGRSLLAECSVIVPVPLHRWKLWRRRFNQAGLLADILSELAGVPHDPFLLGRIKRTRSQVGLTASQRADNVSGAFHVPVEMRKRLLSAAVLLVDDVYTSGATAKAATRALLRAGASSVDVLTFARVCA